MSRNATMGRDARAEPDLRTDPGTGRDGAIDADLAPGERLIWTGRPVIGRPRGLGWLPARGQPRAGLFGLALVAILAWGGLPVKVSVLLLGVGAILAAVVVLMTRRDRAASYAITDRRAIVRERRLGGGVRVASYGAGSFTRLAVTRRPDGSGDIGFGRPAGPGDERHHEARPGPWRPALGGHGFVGVKDVDQIEVLLRRALLGDNRAAPPKGTAGRDDDFAGPDPAAGDDPIRATLAPGEVVVWLGRPRPGMRRPSSHASLRWVGFLVGIVVVGFLAVTSTLSVLHGHGAPPMGIIPLLLAGLALLSAPFWPSRWAERTAYAITDRRALVAEPGRGRGVVVRSYDARALAGCKLDLKRDGKGTGNLLFNDPGPTEDDPEPEGFLAIADARQVDALLRRTLPIEAARPPTRPAAPPAAAGVPGVTNTRVARPAAGWDGPIRAALAPGERLLWAEQPPAGRAALATWPLVLFGLPWLGFGAMGFWMAGNDAPPGNGTFPAVLGAIFLLVGLLCLFSPLWVGSTAGRVVWALTDRRVLLCNPHPFGGVALCAGDLAGIADWLRRERADGSGDLVFGRLRTPAGVETFGGQGFLAVADVARVEALFRAARAGAADP